MPSHIRYLIVVPDGADQATVVYQSTGIVVPAIIDAVHQTLHAIGDYDTSLHVGTKTQVLKDFVGQKQHRDPEDYDRIRKQLREELV